MKMSRLIPSAVALLVLAAGGACLAGTRGPGGSADAGGTATGALTPQIGGRTPPPGHFVLSEFHGGETLLLSVSATDPDERRPLARIPHAPSWAPRAALAPGGERIAYTVLPGGARSPDTEGVLWVVTLQERAPQRLAARVDARTTPVWAPDGSRVIYLRALAGGPAAPLVALEEVSVRDGKVQEVAQASLPVRLFPVGYAPDAARFYYVRFERDGTYLHEVNTRSRAARQVTRLADGAARDFRLSPDGTVLLYLALGGTPARYRAFAAELRTGDIRPLLPEVSRSEDVGVAWRPGARPAASLGVVTGAGGITGRVVLQAGGTVTVTVTERAGGFDVPVAWAPDGRYLVLRSFSGADADHPSSEQPVLLDGDGMRRPLAGGSPVEFVGWAAHAP